MRFTLTCRNLKLNRSIGVYAREKIAKLFGKLFKDPRITQAAIIDIEFSRLTRHHRKGMVWKADAVVALPQQKGPLYAEAVDEDIHSAIDLLSEEIERELQRYKGKSQALARRGARLAKKDLRFDPSARMFRKGRIRDEGN
ncbi:MAG: ribosome-associated translation inhibitor RaiA [Candidatus Sungbacteria bacterium]|nr:ribosome-associated translation inhibitor RaiA [Candidatus Sungbacteria bacterium]